MSAALLASILLAAPPTLGDGLRAIGALDEIDHSLTPPPPPARTSARILIGISGAAVLAGVVGMAVSPGCLTRDAERRCVHARGSAAIFPSLLVLGLGGLTTGAWWFRADLPAGDHQDPLAPPPP